MISGFSSLRYYALRNLRVSLRELTLPVSQWIVERYWIFKKFKIAKCPYCWRKKNITFPFKVKDRAFPDLYHSCPLSFFPLPSPHKSKRAYNHPVDRETPEEGEWIEVYASSPLISWRLVAYNFFLTRGKNYLWLASSLETITSLFPIWNQKLLEFSVSPNSITDELITSVTATYFSSLVHGTIHD